MKLLTVGYLNFSLQALASLVEHESAVLVDIRYSPNSRAPQWRKGELLSLFGHSYRHMKTLGNRNYKGGPIQIDDMDAGGVQVEALFDMHEAVILMCACKDYHRCHRKVVAETIGRLVNLIPEDIAGDKSSQPAARKSKKKEPDHPALFADMPRDEAPPF